MVSDGHLEFSGFLLRNMLISNGDEIMIDNVLFVLVVSGMSEHLGTMVPEWWMVGCS